MSDSDGRRSVAALIIPVAIAVIIMLPRLASPQFGLFDDPFTLQTVERVLNGDWAVDDEAGIGRFRPTYWSFYAFIYLLAGANPFWFLFANLVLLSGIAVGVVLIVRLYGLSNLQAGIAGSLFVLAGPIIENSYTLSKGELQQTLWLVGAVVLSLSMYRTDGTFKRKLLLGGATTAFMFISYTSKETALGVISISVGWLIIAWIRKWRRIEDIPHGLRIRAAFFLATLISLVAYFAIRSNFMPLILSSSGYSSNYVVALDRFLSAGRVWIDWLNRDFLFLLPLFLLALLLFFTRRRFRENIILIDASIWMIGWIAVFLPWIHQYEYYLLPFSVGAAIFSGTIVGYFIPERKTFGRREYGFSALLLGLSVFLFITTVPNYLTQAKLQLMIDRTNDEIVSYLRDNLPDNSVLYVNIPYADTSQYYADLKDSLIELGDRGDLEVEPYVVSDASKSRIIKSASYVLVPYLTNQYYPSIRMGIFENMSSPANELLYAQLGQRLDKTFETSRTIQLSLVDAARLFCPATPQFSYCGVENAPFDTRALSYGWDLYQITGVP